MALGEREAGRPREEIASWWNGGDGVERRRDRYLNGSFELWVCVVVTNQIRSRRPTTVGKNHARKPF